MKITIKKYVARVSDFVEHEDGTITKEERNIVLEGKRFSEAGVCKKIPVGSKLISHGWVENTYEVDGDKLCAWLADNGKIVE